MEFPSIPIDQLRHTRAAQELLEEGRIQGRQEGRMEGLLEALQERQALGAATCILRQLNHRYGPLNPAITAQIKALPLEQLEALADALLNFTGPQDLANWLEANRNDCAIGLNHGVSQHPH